MQTFRLIAVTQIGFAQMSDEEKELVLGKLPSSGSSRPKRRRSRLKRSPKRSREQKLRESDCSDSSLSESSAAASENGNARLDCKRLRNRRDSSVDSASQEGMERHHCTGLDAVTNEALNSQRRHFVTCSKHCKRWPQRKQRTCLNDISAQEPRGPSHGKSHVE